MAGIAKAFGGRAALDGAALEVAAGEVHALLGENGAGKSTLVGVVAGLVRPDAGVLELAGRPIDLASWSPRAARAAGVGMVHQHSTLVPAMTVEENLAFGERAAGAFFRPAAARVASAALRERFGLEVPVGVPVESLSVGQRQRAEILRALSRGARLLVLDEPTAALTPGEARSLFPVLRRLADEGCAVVFISHKLDEIREVADRATVLRRGRTEGTVDPRATDARALGRMMLGRELDALTPATPAARAGPVRLALHGLHAAGLREASALRDLTLDVAAGEIVGVAGIDGNGQRELEEVLAGVREPLAGHLEVDGRATPFGTRAFRAAGVAHLSGDRERAGLVGAMTVAENLVLKSSYDDRRFFRLLRYDVAAADAHARDRIAAFGIVPPEPARVVALLSGGNAQKVAVARELEGAPGALVAVNPTRGLDVGSARFVHEQLLALRARGSALLLVSTELEEVLALADRLFALVRGRLVPVPDGADREALGAILLGEAA
ncbi:MAG TPA: ABC transporter ATP-binding protein [Myxococcota bacterium]|nr:ABC transporter ATP-binding protein [Myxococcota bacterium]